MSIFKAGDKVRVMRGGGSFRGFGETGVVSRVFSIRDLQNHYETYDVEVAFDTEDSDGDTFLQFTDDELELVDEVQDDPVNHPSHYTAYGVEVIEITEHLNFCRGNAVNYIARAGLKNPDKELEDLEKAAFYLNREIARVKEAAK